MAGNAAAIRRVDELLARNTIETSVRRRVRHRNRRLGQISKSERPPPPPSAAAVDVRPTPGKLPEGGGGRGKYARRRTTPAADGVMDDGRVRDAVWPSY